MNILLSVLYSLTITFFLSCVILVAISIVSENLKLFIGTFIFFILSYVCLRMLPNKKEPSKLYQEKVEAVEKANRELEIFLIEHPEFMEE